MRIKPMTSMYDVLSSDIFREAGEIKLRYGEIHYYGAGTGDQKACEWEPIKISPES